MKKLKKISRAFLEGIVQGCLVYGALNLLDEAYGTVVQHNLTKSYPHITQNDFEKDLESQFARIVSLQEKKLGIKHFEKPKISFKPSLLKSHFGRVGGSYNFRTNNLWIDTETENWIDFAMAHELGHAYQDKLNESQGNGNWYIKELVIRPRVVTEGIAEYFESSTFSRKDSLNLSFKDFQSYVGVYGRRAEYEAGYRLVRPILNKNINEGIELLTQNPPTRSDLKDLRAYQQRILNMMSDERNK